MRPQALLPIVVICVSLGGEAVRAGEPGEERVPEAKSPAEVKPGTTGLLKSPKGMAYFLRVPASYDAKKGARLVVFLHGSNMNGLQYLRSFEARKWCDGDLLACPNGEDGKDPYGANNFTFGSAPYVAEVTIQLKDRLKVTRTYIGGHSQGGFVTYSVIMNYPGLYEGAFPMAGDCWMQNEPNLWEEKPPDVAERKKIAIAVIHGQKDPVVDFSQGQHAYEVFDAMAWPALRFFAPENLGHEFALSPVPDALTWLDAVKGDDSAHSLSSAEKWAAAGVWADAVPAALRALEDKKLPSALKARADAVLSKAEKAAKPEAEAMGKALEKEPASAWLPKWFAFRRKFGLTRTAAKLAQFYDACRVKERADGESMFEQAFGAIRGGKKDEGYRLLDELLKKAPHTYQAHYAIKWLQNRKEEK